LKIVHETLNNEHIDVNITHYNIHVYNMYAYNIPIMYYLSSFVFNEPVHAYCSGVGSKCELNNIGNPQYDGLRQPIISIILRVNVVCRHACVPGKGCFNQLQRNKTLWNYLATNGLNILIALCFIVVLSSSGEVNIR